MVHNGIEYGDMQLICEAYNIMKTGLGMSADEMHEVFAEWNKGDLDSLSDRDHARHSGSRTTGDRQADRGQDPGYGRPERHGQMDREIALDLGMPVTLIAEAVLRAACPR